MDNSRILNYRIVGNGYPVLFLHGFLESLEMWEYFSFENHFQCILLDLPGHGKSAEFTDASKSMLSMAVEVQKVIGALEITECALVGHSMGGYVGLELLQSDQRCNKLVLLNSNFWQDSELKKEDRKRVVSIVNKNKNLFLYEAIPNLFSNPENHDSEIKSIIKTAKTMHAETIGLVSMAMAERNGFEQVLPNLEERLLIVQGEFDSIVPKEKMEEALSLLSAIEVKYVKSGHMAHIEETEITQDVILNFLNKG
jgi:2-succinyl-6-hydroxy-2,4-cyclohexadiene-1-carboxylate synthase